MKNLIIVAGDYREFEQAINSWTFIDEIGCDLYFLTWSTSNYKLLYYEGILSKNVPNEECLKTLFSKKFPNINNITVNIQVLPILDDVNLINNTGYLLTLTFQKVLNILLKQPLYKNVIIFRPDLYIEHALNYNIPKILNEEENFLMVSHNAQFNNGFVWCNDMFYMGDYNTVLSFFSKISYIEYKSAMHTDWHLYLGSILSSLDTNIIRTDGLGYYRPIRLTKNGSDISNIYNDLNFLRGICSVTSTSKTQLDYNDILNKHQKPLPFPEDICKEMIAKYNAGYYDSL